MRRGLGSRCVAALLGAGLALAFAAGPAAAKRNVYVAAAPVGTLGSPGQGAVAALDVGVDGSLTAVSGSPYPAGQGAAAATLTPDGRRLYVANTAAGTVSGFDVSPSGALAALGSISTGGTPRGIAVHPSGRALYVANSGPGSISGFAIDTGGGLAPLPGAPYSTGAGPMGLALTPDGTRLYVANQAAGTISGFAIAADGSLTATGTPVATTGPAGLGVSADGRRLYSAGTLSGFFGSQGLVSGFDIGADGTLTPVPSSPVIAGSSALAIAVAPDGRWVFATDPAGARVFSFAVGADGSLSAAPGSPFSTPARPRGVAVSPNSRGLFVAADSGTLLSTTAQVASYGIGAGGTLSQAPGSPFGTGMAGVVDAFGLAISPNQAPTGTFSVEQRDDLAVELDATGSIDGDGVVARYDWDFGDGSVLADGGPTPSHTFPALEEYTITLVVTDNEGCSVLPVFTGQTTSCTGGGRPVAVRSVDFAPPRVIVGGARAQRLDAAVEIEVSCDEPCQATGKGKLFAFIPQRRGGGRRTERAVRELRLRPASVAVAPAETHTLRLRIPPRGRTLARRALDRGGKATATVNVLAVDNFGNGISEPVRVRLRAG